MTGFLPNRFATVFENMDAWVHASCLR